MGFKVYSSPHVRQLHCFIRYKIIVIKLLITYDVSDSTKKVFRVSTTKRVKSKNTSDRLKRELTEYIIHNIVVSKSFKLKKYISNLSIIMYYLFIIYIKTLETIKKSN